ncbi:MAG: nucleotidyltransferase domain-containing protein [Cytophagales bacterium]|nr:nucleotidyltransferase domain-containing protein [Cytophagales bacterium]
MDIGLSEQEKEKLCRCFSSILPLRRVMLFGSRAVGNFRKSSDVDLALEGAELKMEDIFELEKALEELRLSYRFDLVALRQVSNEKLKEHIRRAGVCLWVRE